MDARNFRSEQSNFAVSASLSQASNLSSSTSLLLRLEDDCQTLSWGKSSWSSLRGITGIRTSLTNFSGSQLDYCFDQECGTERYKLLARARFRSRMPYYLDSYTTSSGTNSCTDCSGFVDLSIVKNFTLEPDVCSLQSLAQQQQRSVLSNDRASQMAFNVSSINSQEKKSLLTDDNLSFCRFGLTFGSSPSENRYIEFRLPTETAIIWHKVLAQLINVWIWRSRLKRDGRTDWVIGSYIKLYYRSDGEKGKPSVEEALEVSLIEHLRSLNKVGLYSNLRHKSI